MTVFCLCSSWKVKKKKQRTCKHKKVPVMFFFFASDGPWPLQIILHNTCSLFSTSDFSFGVKKKKKKKKRDWKRAVLFKSALQFDALWIVCFNGCWTGKTLAVKARGECTLDGDCERLRARCPPPDAPPLATTGRQLSCYFFFSLFYCNCSIIFQPSCKFLKLFTATEVLQILYNSVNVL